MPFQYNGGCDLEQEINSISSSIHGCNFYSVDNGLYLGNVYDGTNPSEMARAVNNVTRLLASGLRAADLYSLEVGFSWVLQHTEIYWH